MLTHTESRDVITGRKINDYVNGTNVLGLVAFSVALGVVIAKLREAGEPLKNFFQSLNDAIIMLVKAIMWFVNKVLTFIFIYVNGKASCDLVYRLKSSPRDISR